MEASYFQRHPFIRDVFLISFFVVGVIAGTFLINTFIFRSFSVVGPSMEKTLYTNDRLIINRLPVTWSHLQNKSYIPKRGEIIVFKNPNFTDGLADKYIVKRVIGLPGDHVVLKDGSYIVYNEQNPQGFNPDDANHGEPGSPTSGTADEYVGKNELFVSGDHREGQFSFDSRNGKDGMGLIPSYDIVGPVAVRIYPFDKIRSF